MSGKVDESEYHIRNCSPYYIEGTILMSEYHNPTAHNNRNSLTKHANNTQLTKNQPWVPMGWKWDGFPTPIAVPAFSYLSLSPTNATFPDLSLWVCDMKIRTARMM